jgi:hypothetical protein
MARCQTCPVPAGSTCAAVATRCRRLCELAARDPAYRAHVLTISAPAAPLTPLGPNLSGASTDPWPFSRTERMTADTLRLVERVPLEIDVMVGTEARHVVDRFWEALAGEHYLGWNWQNARHGLRCGFDFDGILCRDTQPGEMPLIDIPPLYLPRRLLVPLIATGRGEECRDASEAWLRKHAVRWQRLEMRPDSVPFEGHAIAMWKAEVYARSDCLLYAESDPEQARTIAQRSGKPVLCPALGRVLAQSSVPQPPSTNLASVFSCPHRAHCRCSTVECRGGKRNGQRVTLADCVSCVG